MEVGAATNDYFHYMFRIFLINTFIAQSKEYQKIVEYCHNLPEHKSTSSNVLLLFAKDSQFNVYREKEVRIHM